jgi:magnesium-protoporphyrin O-methyltransferase
LHWIGGRFPHSQRRTDIQMLHDKDVHNALRGEGMHVARQQRISSGFYHVTLVEAVRET